MVTFFGISLFSLISYNVVSIQLFFGASLESKFHQFLFRLASLLNLLCIPQFSLAFCLVNMKDSRDLIEGVSKLDNLLIVSVF